MSGADTRDTARLGFVAEHTVQDHLKSIELRSILARQAMAAHENRFPAIGRY